MGTQTKHILIVDDEVFNLRFLNDFLSGEGYKITLAENGKKALEILETFDKSDLPDLIITDINMPEIDGLTLIKKIKSCPELQTIPIIVITGYADTTTKIEALALDIDDFLHKPFNIIELGLRVKNLLRKKEYFDSLSIINSVLKEFGYKTHEKLELAIKKLNWALHELKSRELEIVMRLLTACEYRDDDTFDHVLRMSHYSGLIATAINYKSHPIYNLMLASAMHDIGKIGVPDSILLKPGKLTDSEWQIIKMHPAIGKKMLQNSRSPLIKLAEIIAYTHHEKWDGSGYPEGLKEKEIPLEGRIVAIADVFDALTSKRPYKEAFPISKSVKIMMNSCGSHFDPELLKIFLDNLDKIREIKKTFTGIKYSETNLLKLFKTDFIILQKKPSTEPIDFEIDDPRI